MVKLVACRLIGCQSHEDTYFEFVDGLNVIIADNNVGKSVFMKMLKIACHPKAIRREDWHLLIRWGHEAATAMYSFSDGSCGAVKVFPNKVMYFFTEKLGEIPFETSVNPDPRLIKNLAVMLDPDEVFFGNIIDLDQALLLVDSSDKANNNLIQLAINDRRINFLKDLFKERAVEYRKHLDELDKIVITFKARLEKTQYVDVNRLEEKVSIFEAGVHIMDKLIEVGRELNNLERVIEHKDYDFLIFLCELYSECTSNLESLVALSKTYDDTLINTFDVLCSCNIEDLIPIDRDTSRIVDTAIVLAEASESMSDLKVVNFSEDLLSFVDIMSILGNVGDSLEEMSAALEKVQERKETISYIEREISTLGVRVPCKIYGEVQHIDGNCIPIGDGSSST